MYQVHYVNPGPCGTQVVRVCTEHKKPLQGSYTGHRACNACVTRYMLCKQVVQVCAEHKKPRKLLKHLDAARAASQRQRHPPRCLIFTNKVPRVVG